MPRKMFESSEYCCVPFLNSKHNEHNKLPFNRFLLLDDRKKEWVTMGKKTKKLREAETTVMFVVVFFLSLSLQTIFTITFT